MKFIFSYVLLIVFLTSCGDEEQNNNRQLESEEMKPDSLMVKREPLVLETYSNDQLAVKLEYPPHFAVEESRLPAETPVLNIYDTTNVKSPPYAIHEDASLAYIAVLPEGYGVDAPAGTRISYREWRGNLSMNFEVDPDESTVYLLESGEAWAYSLTPRDKPRSWNDYGIVFVHPKIDSFEGRCFDAASGEEKPMTNCRPMGGEDEVRYSGEPNKEIEEDLLVILQSIRLQ